MAACELELVCPHCQATEICGSAQMLARLRSLSLLRREAKPEASLLVELFRCSVSKFACHACDAIGLDVREPSSEGWGEARTCIDCFSRIPSERLELFPDAKRCAACEAKSQSHAGLDREFCPRCGEVLTLKLRRGGGIARYDMTCPHCRS